jgi:hypothetical protein
VYVVVDYKTNTRVKESFSTFMEAFDVFNKINKETYKIEYWNFKDKTCKLVWTNSYEDCLV